MAPIGGSKPLTGGAHHGHRGFTLVELIVVLVLVSVVAAMGQMLFFSRNQFDAYGFAEDIRSSLRYAQKSAIAKRRTVCVVSASNTLTFTFSSINGGACDTALRDPSDAPNDGSSTNTTSFTRTAPECIAISAASFSFDPLGRPSAAQSLVIDKAAGCPNLDATTTIVVEAETGYVH